MRVEEMLAQLEAHPEVTIVRKILFPGIEEEELEDIEGELGCRLITDVRDFFQQHNGIAIEWYWKDNPKMEGAEFPDAELEPNLSDLLWDYGPPIDGQFIVGPLEEFLVPEYDLIDAIDSFGAAEAFYEHLAEPAEDATGGVFSMGERQFDSEGEFRSKLRYFDFFSRDTGAVLLFEEGNPDPPVYYEPFRSGGFTPEKQASLSHYLKYVIDHFGLRWRRDLLFAGQQSIVSGKGIPNSLEEVLAYCKKFHSG